MPNPHLRHLRPLEAADMAWLLPMAERYGERDGLLAAMLDVYARILRLVLGRAEGGE